MEWNLIQSFFENRNADVEKKMRFSAVQENSYGVGLEQKTPTFVDDVDESMMAASRGVEPRGECASEEGSMISNLPLLFASGYPTCLEKITLVCLIFYLTEKRIPIQFFWTKGPRIKKIYKKSALRNSQNWSDLLLL